jgi:hypothetical protein
MTWFFTSRYIYNVHQICYIHYVHFVSLEAGIFLIFRVAEILLIFEQFIIYTEPLRRTISLLPPHPVLPSAL